MNIAIIGTGYVGLVTGALLAGRGNNVVCIDQNTTIIENLQQGIPHFFEPGLQKIVQENMRRNTLSFAVDMKEAVAHADIIFLAVGTPSLDTGEFNLQYLTHAAREVGTYLKNASGFKVIVTKSTVPQGTYKKIESVLQQEIGYESDVEWAYVSNPETLAEGSAVRDFSKPDRIIVGTTSDRAYELMKELYHPFTMKRDRIFRGSPADAELAKLFSNTALAARVSMVNEFARIADITTGADMDTVRKMVCEDKRIGYNFMFPSPGYGGSCFPKDIQGLVHQSKLDGYAPHLLSTIHDSNEFHKSYVGDRVNTLLATPGAKIAIWGCTFKPNTDDIRDAASIPIITALINRGANIHVFDPMDTKAREIFGSSVTFGDSQYGIVKDADALILLTEWRQFDSPNFVQLCELMKGNKLFDLRNRWVPQAANRAGFDYFGIGRNYHSQ